MVLPGWRSTNASFYRVLVRQNTSSAGRSMREFRLLRTDATERWIELHGKLTKTGSSVALFSGHERGMALVGPHAL